MTERVEPVPGLREYFRDLDRVAPADGQLSEVLMRSAVVKQRPQWQAGLPRVGWKALGGQFPLRYALLAVVMLLVTLAVSVGGGRARGPFEGRWTSTDTDGSTQILDVGPGPSPDVHFEDLMASGCAENHDDSVDFRADGHGAVLGDRLVVGFPGGGCHTWRVAAFSTTYQRDPSTGTMIDGDGVTWTRTP